jgi:hypothetical protein
MENDPIVRTLQKYTVQEVYDMINADLDAAFALNSLPDMNVNQMRVKSLCLRCQSRSLYVDERI